MDKKEYLNSLKALNDAKGFDLNLTLKSLGEAIAQSEKDLAFYKQQQIDIGEQIIQLGNDNTMLDEIINDVPADNPNEIPVNP